MLQIVEVVYTGEITARDLRESISEFIALEQEKGMNKFFVDTTEMKLAASIVDFFALPTKQYLQEKADTQGHVAIIPPNCPRAEKAIKFYETVCRNRGWMVPVFSQSQEAVDWLVS